ncbi:MAG: phage baseplate assembly protein V [Bacteroidota bacterium]
MTITDSLLGIDYSKYACNLSVNGMPLPSDFQLISVQIKQGYQYISSAQISLKQEVGFGNPLTINPLGMPFAGNKLSIKAKLDFDEIDIFEGTIVKHKYKNSKNGTRLQIMAKTKAINLAINIKSEVFAKQSDKEVIESIVQTNGCSLEATNLTTEFMVKHSQLVKNEISDWDFINLRAEANGCFVFTEKDKVLIDKPKQALDPTAIIPVKYGDNIFEIEMEQDDRLLQIENEIISFNLTSLKSESVKEDPILPSPPAVPIKGKVAENNYRTFNDLEVNDLLKAKTELKSLSKLSGLVHIKANLIAKVGGTLDISGFNDLVDGKFIITAITHDYSEGGFSTYLQFGLNHQSFKSRFGLKTENLNPTLLTGIVTQLQDDPDNLNRIQVKIANWNHAQEMLWARISTFYAGDKYGFFILPEVGDEVLVTFMGNDFDVPVIIGSVFSPAKPPHTQAKDDNQEKVFITRKGMKWAWNDEKGTHEISTASGNKILISEEEKSITIEDENTNKIVMNDSEINMTGSKDINIKANANIKIEGVNIELSASGIAKIKGSMVQVN